MRSCVLIRVTPDLDARDGVDAGAAALGESRCGLRIRPRQAIAAENLVLRCQLSLYEEGRVASPVALPIASGTAFVFTRGRVIEYLRTAGNV